MAAVLVALRAGDAGAAIGFVQLIGTAFSGVPTTTLSVTVPAGGVVATHKLIVALAIDPAVGTVSGTDTRGNTYGVDADVTNGSGITGVRAVVLSALVTTTLSAGDTITVTFPSVAASAMSVNEFSGVSTLDQTAYGTGNTVAATTAASAPTSQANELLFGLFATEAKKADPFVPGALYTGLTRENSGTAGPSEDNVTTNPEYRVVAGTGSYVADASIWTHNWAGALVTYRAVACGNAVIEPGEQCDDGNLLNGDCCAATCQFEVAGTSCRAAAGVCDVAETCTGSSGTCPPDGKSTAVCRPVAGVCDVAESCDGVADACPADAFEPTTTVCRPAAGVCDVADRCPGTGASCPADAKGTTVCRPAAGVCDVAESCDGVADACPADGFEPTTTVCRPAAGACDVADRCPGTGASCPADAKSTAVCRPVADVCDVAESCDGVADACPADAFEPTTTVCRPAAGVCDVADRCPGTGASCPADAKGTTVCRPAVGVCDVAESCDGASDDCPADAFAPTTTVCRPAAGVCDPPEYCAGTCTTCPLDGKSTAVCRPAVDACDVAESCDGVGDACPADTLAPSTTVCRPAAGGCDLPETCTGASVGCPADAKSAAVCRPVAGPCDVAETCDGVSDDCPADTARPDVDSDGDGVCDLVDDCPAARDPAQTDGDHDGVGDACDPCTNVVPVFAAKPKVKIGKLPVPGGAKLQFKGIVTVPTSPPIDPATNGVRVLLADAGGASMLDVTVPGKLGWKANAARTAWRYRNPAGLHSIVAVRVRAVRGTPGQLKFQVTGRHGTYAMSPSAMPVRGTIVIDAPVARTGQCGEAFFPGPPAPACKLRAAGRVLSCS